MTEHDPFMPIHKQISDLLLSVGSLRTMHEGLDKTVTGQVTRTNKALRTIEDTLNGIRDILASHTEAIESLPELTQTVRELAELLPPQLAEDVYKPENTRRWWWDLDPANDHPDAPGTPEDRTKDRDEAVADLREWVETIYRPYYGYMSGTMGDCWEQHDMCLVILDCMSELWKFLYLSSPRTPRSLSAQVDWQMRAVKELADQLATECPAKCPAHHPERRS